MQQSNAFLFYLIDINNLYYVNDYNFDFFYNIVKENCNIETIKKQCKDHNLIYDWNNGA